MNDRSLIAGAGWCAPPETTYGPDAPEYLGFGQTPTLADEIAASANEPQALRGGIKYPTPDPIQFPAPRDSFIADRIEATAAQIQEGFPYRTLLDCRQLAARLVDEVLTWDAEWPEAEGDCGCVVRRFPDHQPDCIWNGEEGTL